MKKKLLIIGIVLFAVSPLLAQDLGLEQKAQTMWDDIKASAKYIFAAIFLVSALANSGKLVGENRDYMAFFRGLLLWFVAMTLIAGVIAFILGQTF
jgi:hypothetical protein